MSSSGRLRRSRTRDVGSLVGPIAASLISAVLLGGAIARAQGANDAAASPTLIGSTGLHRLSTAEVGTPRELRLALRLEHARSTDLLLAGDVNHRTRALLAAAFTAHRNLELFAAMLAIDNYNRVEGATGGESVNDLHGAALAGAKLVVPLAGSLSVGAEVGARVPTDVEAIARAASPWVALLGSVDLAPRFSLPVRVHAGAGYHDDNSRRQVDFAGLPMSTRQRVAFAHGMGASRFGAAVGLDAPLLASGSQPRPWLLAEYHFEYVTSDPDPAFRDQSPYNRDQHWLTFGLRMRFARMVFDAGVDVLLRGPGYIHGPPLPPYNLFIGVAVPVRL